ncbi:MAG: mechanosensitive ion channel [Bacteroides sp.]|nr:mechanosensitive ion channel [Bacteroides sp.]
MLQTNDLPIVNLPDSPEDAKSALEAFKGLSLDDAITKIANSMVDFAFKLVIAILVFYAGRYIIKKLYKWINTLMTNRRVDPSLTTFVLSLVKMVLYFILLITIIGILGLETSSFLAIFASAGVAIGMALSGTLQNFAGGVLILLLKPYKVGDFIEAQGYSGTVKAIQIFHTIINTPDNKTIIVPNGGLSTGSINNYSAESYRRVDWTVSLAYGTDFKKAADEICRLLLLDDRIVKQYIEDDIEKRRQAGIPDQEQTEEELKDEETLDNASEDEFKAPKTWIGRIFESRRHKRLRLKSDLRHKIGLEKIDTPKLDRSPFVGLSEMADSSINLTVRAWTHSSNYWGVYFDMNKVFYTELPNAGFSFPFPQLDVHFDSPVHSPEVVNTISNS